MRPISELGVDILRELNKDELKDLIHLYKSKGDRYHCMWMYNYCRWSRQLEKLEENDIGKWKPLKQTYYTHRYGNLATNGTYISLQWDVKLSVQFHTLEETLEELKECIAETKLIDWQSGPLLTAIHTDCVDEIVDLIRTLGGSVDYEIPCTCYILERSIALKIQVPSTPKGYELRPLQQRNADFVHSLWPHNEEASVDFIRGMIEFNLTLGVFRLEDDELIGWIFQNEFHGLGILQVVPKEQGKGFGKLLTRAMTKKIAVSDDNDVASFAVVGNVRSENIVMQVGFKKNCVTKWVQIKKSL